jgi:hypothetical protein
MSVQLPSDAKVEKEWSRVAPPPARLYGVYAVNFIFLSLVSVLPHVFVDCHVRADHNW